jgi:hypothetical protein
MKLTIRRRQHHGRWWWHWQLTHPTFGRCGNGWAPTHRDALLLGLGALDDKERRLAA